MIRNAHITGARGFILGVAMLTLTGAAGWSSVQAQDLPTIQKDAAQVPAGQYEIDVSHANITFEIAHLGISNYVGRFNDFTGTATFDPKNMEASAVEVTIKAASVDTNHEVLENELRGEQFLNTAKFPDITFTSSKLTLESPTTGKLHGDVTLHGVTKPMVLDVTFDGGLKNPLTGKYTIGFSASGQLKRTDHGITSFIPVVGDDVTFRFNGEFIHK